MPENSVDEKAIKKAKISLGKSIKKCRGTLSQSQLAQAIGLPRSNMKYIEDGVNAPTAEAYDKLIQRLKPDKVTRRRMDNLYMAIRKVPPPDVCRTITRNKDLIDAMRMLEDFKLTKEQLNSISVLFASFNKNREGELLT